MTAGAGGATRRRVGVFGGTFDPPHVGHLLVAGDAAEQLALDVLLWMPARAQPLKSQAPAVAGAEERRRMVGLTVEGDSRFALDSLELDREGLSFTVDTLATLREREPDTELFLLIGEDSWRTFPSWREPARIRALATVAVLARVAGGGSGVAAPGAREDEPLRLTTRRVDVSATEIRERVARGLPIRGFVTEDVEQFIRERGLYRSSR